MFRCLPFLRKSATPTRTTRLSAPASSTSSDEVLCCCACDPLPEYTRGSWSSPPVAENVAEKMRSTSEVGETIASEIERLNEELRALSLDMWNHPEVAWKEHYTHDLFVKYLQKQQGWNVQPHAYDLDTAFRAEFTHTPQGFTSTTTTPVIGFQSELDALPGIGHACGHNLIAISGVAASLGLAKAAVEHNFAVKIILIGTPAEEAGGGKRELIARGAYKEMDACLMLHPAPYDSTGTMLAVQQVSVEYKGHSAHAGASPWEAVNAQDAGVLAYVNISALRQQIHPSYRVHGIIVGKNWAPNVIPEACTLVYNTRAPTAKECNALTERVKKCFQAAAEATGCSLKVDVFSSYKDVANNANLSDAFRSVTEQRYHRHVSTEPWSASTDFGDVTHELPALHAEYSIPLKNIDTDKNHTIGFTHAAKTEEAHRRTLESSTSIAIIAAKVAMDEEYRQAMWTQWKEWKKSIGE